MFNNVNIENYDLKNDLHRARFFHDCLKDELVFSKPKSDPRSDEKDCLCWRSTGYEGIVTPEISVKSDCYDILYIEGLLYFIYRRSIIFYNGNLI